MSDAPPPSPTPRGPLIAASLIVVLGFVFFGTGMIAAMRAEVSPRMVMVLGHPAWQFATVGFVCTLAGGMWLRRLVR